MNKLQKFLAVYLILVFVLIGSYLLKSGHAAPVLAQSTPTASGPNYYGINWHPVWIDNGVQDVDMDLMKKAGIKSVRIDAAWYFLEPSKGAYRATYMARLDNAVNGLIARGIDPLVIVSSTPQWVTNAPKTDHAAILEPPIRSIINPKCDPTLTICTPYNHSQDYDNFLSYLMHHWAGKIHEYEIWNEPVGDWSWHRTETDWIQAATDVGKDYTTLLKSAYTTAKAIDPNIMILGGSLSNTDGPNEYFLKSMYANGAKNFFDVSSQHYYCDPPSDNWCAYKGTPASRNTDDPVTLGETFTKNIYPIMQANGDGGKPVWVTETGYNSYSAGGGISEAQQAQNLTGSFAEGKTLPNVARLYWYDMDCSDSGTTTQNYYCILEDGANSTYRLKPAYTALKQLTNPSLVGDLNKDGKVDVFDLSIFLSHFRQSGSKLPEDFNNDGVINILDLSIILSNYT